MPGPFLKIVRALFCALVLTLIGVGSHLARVEVAPSGTEAHWGMKKGAKPAAALSTRAGATCSLTVAVHAAASRVAPSAPGDFFRTLAQPKIVVVVAAAGCKPEREPGARAMPGGVRLLI